MMSELGAPLWLSIRVAVVATALAVLVAVPVAFAVARMRSRLRSAIDALIVLPLVLPPTVVGYLLLVVLGSRGFIGQWLREWFGYSIIFRFEAAVLAAAVVALPLVYLPTKTAFESVDPDLIDLGRLLGADRLRLFWHVSLPLARRGLAGGCVLGMARALGEFGATIMVFGWQPGQQTLPLVIYSHYEQGQLNQATAAVTVTCALSLSLILIHNRWLRER